MITILAPGIEVLMREVAELRYQISVHYFGTQTREEWASRL